MVVGTINAATISRKDELEKILEQIEKLFFSNGIISL